MLLFVSVELDEDGRPDLQLPAGAQIDTHPWGAIVYWRDNTLLLDKLGRLGGALRFLCHGGAGVVAKLAHLGASAQRMQDVWPTLTASQKTWLHDRRCYIVRRNGTPVGIMPRHVIAGTNPRALALAHIELADGDVITDDRPVN